MTRREWWTGPGRYLLLGGPLFLLLWRHSWGDAWLGDFWAHVASVHELGARPFGPKNPLFGNDYAFPFFSPYAWAVGIASRVLGLRAFDMMVVQGLVNLGLLLAALYAFVGTWLRRPAAAVYALLFVLFLWGADPWVYSSFFHLRSLAFVLPYPSTFAFALALGSLAALLPLIRSGRLAWVPLAIPALSFLWIAHPVNGLFLAAGLTAASLQAPRPRRHWPVLALALTASFVLALAWPLFPVADLWFRQAAVIHGGNDPMYDSPLRRVGPALLGVPWLAARLRRHPRDPLAVFALIIVLAVVYGGVSGEWTFGRLISHAAILLQIAAADASAALEDRLARTRRDAALPHLIAPAAAALLIGLSWSTAVRPTLDDSRGGDPRWLAFLESRVGRDDVVLTDLDTCWYVPSFAGKVVAYPMHLPFVPDHAERLRSVGRFFERGVPQAERRAIVDAYGAGFVLLAKDHFDDGPARLEELRTLGSVVYSDPDYELLQVGPAGPRP